MRKLIGLVLGLVFLAAAPPSQGQSPPAFPQVLADKGCMRFLGRADEALCFTGAAHDWCLGLLAQNKVKACALQGYGELGARIARSPSDLPGAVTAAGCTPAGNGAFDCAAQPAFIVCTTWRNGGTPKVTNCRKTPEALSSAPQDYVSAGGVFCHGGCSGGACDQKRQLACTLDKTLRSWTNDAVSQMSAEPSPARRLSACYGLTTSPFAAQTGLLTTTAKTVAPGGPAPDAASFASGAKAACYNRILLLSRF